MRAEKVWWRVCTTNSGRQEIYFAEAVRAGRCEVYMQRGVRVYRKEVESAAAAVGRVRGGGVVRSERGCRYARCGMNRGGIVPLVKVHERVFKTRRAVCNQKQNRRCEKSALGVRQRRSAETSRYRLQPMLPVRLNQPSNPREEEILGIYGVRSTQHESEEFIWWRLSRCYLTSALCAFVHDNVCHEPHRNAFHDKPAPTPLGVLTRRVYRMWMAARAYVPRGGFVAIRPGVTRPCRRRQCQRVVVAAQIVVGRARRSQSEPPVARVAEDRSYAACVGRAIIRYAAAR